MKRAPDVVPVRMGFVEASAKRARVLETMRHRPGARVEAADLQSRAREVVEDLRRRERVFPEDEAHLRTFGMGVRTTVPRSAAQM